MKSLSYVEIDVPAFADTGDLDASLTYDFTTNSLIGWTGSEVTATATVNGATLAPTGDDPIFQSPAGLTIDGATSRYIQIDVERTAVRTQGSWQGSVFYVTDGHAFSGSFTNSFPALANTIGAREVYHIDMHDLDVGGTDWADSTITRLRVDFEDGQVGTTPSVEVKASACKAAGCSRSTTSKTMHVRSWLRVCENPCR